jgi:hypothetical protein
MNIISNSQAGQDIFVLNVLKGKRNGVYVEIGSNCPVSVNNNTYVLESNYGWTGLMIEYDQSFENLYKAHRPCSHYIINDARYVNYREFLDSNQYPLNIDYLQIDLDVNNRSTLDTLILLDNTVFDKYKFAIVTFEHDIYTGNWFDTRKRSREIFMNRGYVLVFPDIKVFYGGQYVPFEDWYVHPELVDMTYIEEIKSDSSMTCDDIKMKLYQITSKNIMNQSSSILSLNSTNNKKRYNIILPLARFGYLDELVGMLSAQVDNDNIVVHIIIDDNVEINVEIDVQDKVNKYPWINVYKCPNSGTAFWFRCNNAMNWFLDTYLAKEDEMYLFLNDDDFYEPDFFKKIAKHDAEIIICAMERGHFIPHTNDPNKAHTTHKLIAAPENMKVGHVGVEQIIISGKILKEYRFPLHNCGDGMMIAKVVAQNSNLVIYVNEARVWFNYLEPGRWIK